MSKKCHLNPPKMCFVDHVGVCVPFWAAPVPQNIQSGQCLMQKKVLKCREIAWNLNITGKNAQKMLKNGQKLPFKPPKNLLCRLCRSVRPVLGRTCTSKHIARAMPHAKKSVKMSWNCVEFENYWKKCSKNALKWPKIAI